MEDIDLDFFTGQDEIELTPLAIEKIVLELNMSLADKEWLQDAASQGMRWNTKRKSVVGAMDGWDDVVSDLDQIKNRKIRRNDICPCGSGLKYKKCCL
jgi:uncharacterized protein YecA (UPF0149 family)